MVCFHVAFSVKSLITATPMFEVNLLSSHLEKKKKRQCLSPPTLANNSYVENYQQGITQMINLR